MRVAVLGQGYVGLPLAIRAAELGYMVVGLEIYAAKVEQLAVGHSYVEDVTSERLQAVLAAGTYYPSSDVESLRNFDIAIITVPTPLKDKAPDMTAVESASHMIGKYLRPGAAVVLESTTYPGTTEELVANILLEESGLKPEDDYYLGFSPERIDPGNPQFGFQNTTKLVSGVGPRSLQVIGDFYRSLCDNVVEVSSPKIAELAKILENTFRHVNIALVNELAMHANQMSIDMHEVVSAASTKPFGFMPFYPGPGVGGHCLPIDPAYMSWRVKTELGSTFRFAELADDINHHMPDYVVSRATEALNDQSKAVKGSKVLILGMAYKAGTSDVRESPAIKIVELLRSKGADVTVCDPHIPEFQHDDQNLEYGMFDLVVMVTPHEEFDVEAIASLSNLILDTRHVFSPAPHVQYL